MCKMQTGFYFDELKQELAGHDPVHVTKLSCRIADGIPMMHLPEYTCRKSTTSLALGAFQYEQTIWSVVMRKNMHRCATWFIKIRSKCRNSSQIQKQQKKRFLLLTLKHSSEALWLRSHENESRVLYLFKSKIQSSYSKLAGFPGTLVEFCSFKTLLIQSSSPSLASSRTPAAFSESLFFFFHAACYQEKSGLMALWLAWFRRFV